MSLLNPGMKFKNFWTKSIMKVEFDKNIHKLSQGPPNPWFRPAKLQNKDFLKNTRDLKKKKLFQDRMNPSNACTEVGRVFLNYLQKLFLNKVFNL